MAKRKNRNLTPTVGTLSSVENTKKLQFATDEEWREQMPQWLKEIRAMADCGDVKRAKELLAEDVVGPRLAEMDDINVFYFACHELARACFLLDFCEDALKYCQKALEIQSDAGLYNLLGLIYRANCQNTLAIENLTKAFQLKPEEISIWSNLAMCLIKVGRAKEAIDMFRKVVKVDPCHGSAYSNLLLHLNYVTGIGRGEVIEEAKKWARIKVSPELARNRHDNVLHPERSLRIGYISPDFKEHSVMFFFESLLIGHDRDNFKIYGYGNIQNPDDVTERTIQKFDKYHNVRGMEHEAVTELIESEKIDILVELSGHTNGNSLEVLAQKPAPIQVSYLGYPNTTGMSQIDYRLSDDLVDPPGQQDYYTEKLISLPNGFLCYNPGEVQPTVKALPASINDFVTFGCFNNISKINPELMEMWVAILNALPTAKLILKYGEFSDDKVKEYYLGEFQRLGLNDPKERIEFIGWLPSPKHLQLYNSVDIALDTYPYNGTTTTCQALLMGVPVISLMGHAHASRVGFDILSRLDLQFFAAKTPDEYIKKAIALASKPEALTKIRETMRQRLAASCLCNYEVITKDIENAYRKMWRDYCETKMKEKLNNRFKETLSNNSLSETLL